MAINQSFGTLHKHIYLDQCPIPHTWCWGEGDRRGRERQDDWGRGRKARSKKKRELKKTAELIAADDGRGGDDGGGVVMLLLLLLLLGCFV